MKKIFVVFALVSLGWLISGCNTVRPKENFISQNACELPCWNNIIQGAGDREYFIDQISTSYYIEKDSISNEYETWFFYTGRILFQYSDLDIRGVGYLIDDKVSVTEFDGNLNVSIGQVVEILGEPKYIINISVRHFNIVKLIFPDLGISFSYSTEDVPQKIKNEFSPEIPLGSAIIFDISLYDELLNKGLFSDVLLNGEETRKNMNLWDGYGSLHEKYPPAKIQ